MSEKPKYVGFGELRKLDQIPKRIPVSPSALNQPTQPESQTPDQSVVALSPSSLTGFPAVNQVSLEPRPTGTGFSEPRPNKTPFSQDPVPIEPRQVRQLQLNANSPGFRIPNYLEDELFPTLSVYEQIVLRRLYRLSYGFNRQTTDPISISKLAEKCNISESCVKRALKSLQLNDLITATVNTTGTHTGNQYTVLANYFTTPLLTERGPHRTGSSQTSIKHDHDDHKQYNHHQKAQTPQKDDDSQPNTPHFQHVKTTYQDITGNPWSAKDTKAYAEIAAIPPETIEAAIRVAFSRAPAPPRSLAYFIPEIKTQHQPPKSNRAANKRQLREIAEEVRTRFVGHSLTMGEFSEQIKHLAANRGINYGGGMLTEVLEELHRNHSGS